MAEGSEEGGISEGRAEVIRPGKGGGLPVGSGGADMIRLPRACARTSIFSERHLRIPCQGYHF